MRLAARTAGLVLDDVLLGLTPERLGASPWGAGETTRLRLWAEPGRRLDLARLVAVLAGPEPVGTDEFVSGGSLALKGLDWPGRERGFPDAGAALAAFIAGRTAPPALGLDFILPEVAALESLSAQPWRLEFTAPLRLTRSAGEPGCGHYAGPFFFEDPAGLARFLDKLRWQGPAPAKPPAELRVAASRVDWRPFKYSRERQVTLGGLQGFLLLDGRPDFETACRLVLGQYLGVGKSPRFGCGFFRLPGLDLARSWPLFPAPVGKRSI
ncbi:MAG: hypothetical protein LBP33_13665 [Candidatus Adiutrix sp.]|jgi:hypothetical protein|nr:hypothetical protein [Candidatus Adiutrix sp.]